MALALGASAMAPALTAQTAQRFAATKANDYALVYSLPTTQLAVTLEAEITVKEPGEFYKYAKKYLNISNPITKESRTVRLKSATITTRGIANTDERYAIQFKSGTSPYVLIADNNVPLAINTEQTLEVEAPQLPESVPAPPTPLQTSAARQVISEEMMQSQSTAKRAELAATALYDICLLYTSPSSSPDRPSRRPPTASRSSSCSTISRHRKKHSWPCLSAPQPSPPMWPPSM